MDLSGLLSLGITVPALLTAAASLVALVISKETKVSETRQAWIKEVRDELATFIALSRQNAQYWEEVQQRLLTIIDPVARSAKEVELQSQHLPHAIGVSTSAARIKLMLSAHDTDTDTDKSAKAEIDALIERVAEIQRAYRDTTRTLRLTINLHEIAGPVLQREWRQVRTGEPVYRKLLMLSSVALFTLLLAAIIASAQKSTRASVEKAAPQTGQTRSQLPATFEPKR